MNFFQPLHRRVIGGIAAAFLLLFLFASCSHQPQQVVYADAQPQVVQGAPTTIVQPVAVGGGYGGGFGGDGFFTGLMAGHLMSGGFGGDGFFTGLMAGHLMSGGFGSRHTTVEHVYHAPIAVAPAGVAPALQRPVPAYRPAPTVTTNARGISTVNRSTSTSRSISVGRRR